MEDEEGYTVLNLRPKWGNSAHLSPAGHQDSPPCPRWHGVALKAGSAGLLLLLATVAGLGVWVFQGCPSKAEERPAWTSNGVTPITSNGRAYNSSLEDLVSRLKQSVCDPAQINSAGGARCKLCPVNWRLHEDKCYWLSKELNSWSESREDCTRKGSEMLVIQNTEQMDHLQSALPEADHIWIGLAFNSSQGKWTWLDGASVPELGPRMGKVNTNSCGVLQRRNIEFENCSVKLKWPCLKAAFPLTQLPNPGWVHQPRQLWSQKGEIPN